MSDLKNSVIWPANVTSSDGVVGGRGEDIVKERVSLECTLYQMSLEHPVVLIINSLGLV